MKKIIENNSLFLTPTFIGLLNLLLISFSLNEVKIKFRKETVFRFSLPSSNARYSFSETALLKEIGKYSVDIYCLTGNKEDEKKIALIRLESLKIKFTCNLKRATRIHLSDETTYDKFVRLIEIANMDKHDRYGLIQDDFYFFPPVDCDCTKEETSPEKQLIYH